MTNKNILIISGAALIVGVASTVAAKAIYERTQIPTDKRALIISSIVAIGGTFLMIKLSRKK